MLRFSLTLLRHPKHLIKYVHHNQVAQAHLDRVQNMILHVASQLLIRLFR